MCEVCGKLNVEKHHIRTRGAGGGDDEENIIFLCREHHAEIHTIGRNRFFKKYNLPNKIKQKKCVECGVKLTKYRYCPHCQKFLCQNCFLKGYHNLKGCVL